MVVKQQEQRFTDLNGLSVGTDVRNVNTIKPIDFDEICDYSEVVSKNFKNFTVINEKGKPRFKIDEEFRVIYKTSKGDIRCADITDFAFTQLCTHLGLPASYVKKCFENGKEELALTNFRAWSNDLEKNLVFKEYQGVIRGVVTESYKSFSNRRMCDTLRNTVDFDRYMPIQANLQPESITVRFIERESSLVDGDTSPIWNGFMIRNNDVGGGTLQINDFMYRQWCTNGCVTRLFDGTAFKQSHRGESAGEGKIVIFSQIFKAMYDLKDEKLKLMNKSASKKLEFNEYMLFMERVSANLRLSEEAEKNLTDITMRYYANNGKDLTEWSVINGITQLAQKYTLDKRLDLETYAGKLLTASSRRR